MIDIEEFLEFLHSFPFKSSAYLNFFALFCTKIRSFVSDGSFWVNGRFEPARHLVELMVSPFSDWPWILVSVLVLEETGEVWIEDWNDAWAEGWTEGSTEDRTVASAEGWSFFGFFLFRFFSSTFNFFSLTLTASPSMTWVFPDATKWRHLFVLWI